MVQFPNGIRKRILRNGSSWGEVSGFKEDKTLSGKPKRIMCASMTKRPFLVKMLFTYDEYLIFTDWYNNTCYKGLYSFSFPTVDRFGVKSNKEYQFAAGSAPQYSNPSGKNIECTMQWEEV